MNLAQENLNYQSKNKDKRETPLAIENCNLYHEHIGCLTKTSNNLITAGNTVTYQGCILQQKPLDDKNPNVTSMQGNGRLFLKVKTTDILINDKQLPAQVSMVYLGVNPFLDYVSLLIPGICDGWWITWITPSRCTYTHTHEVAHAAMELLKPQIQVVSCSFDDNGNQGICWAAKYLHRRERGTTVQ